MRPETRADGSSQKNFGAEWGRCWTEFLCEMQQILKRWTFRNFCNFSKTSACYDFYLRSFIYFPTGFGRSILPSSSMKLKYINGQVCYARRGLLHSILFHFFLNKEPDALIIQIYSVSRQSQDGTQFHPDSAWKRSSKTCMKLSSAEYTVKSSWWRAERMPETCRVL